MTMTVEEALPPPPAKMSFEEFLSWADEDTFAEWVGGEVIFMTTPNHRHQLLASFLVSLIQHWIEARGVGGMVLTAPFLMRAVPGGPGREPDVLYIAPENLGRLRGVYLEGPADLVVEIVSPESRRRDRTDKFFEFERAGVREYWALDIDHELPEFFRLDDTGAFRRIAPGEDGFFESAVLPGFRLEVSHLWQSPLPTLLSILKTWGLIQI